MKFNSLKTFFVTAEGIITIAILITISVVIMAFNFTNYFNRIEWGAMLGAIGSLSAAGIALFTVWFQIYKYNNDRKPAISPLTKDVILNNLTLHDNWDTNEKLLIKWSETTLDIGNFGITPIIDMEYVYFFDNFNDVQREINKTNHSLSLDSIPEKDSSFYVELFDEQREINNHKKTFRAYAATKGKSTSYQIRSLFIKSNSIRTNETIAFKLPSYFLVLNNYIQLALSQNMRSYDMANVPKLNLIIMCTDIDQRKWEIIYQIYMWDAFDGKRKYNSDGSTTTLHTFQIAFSHITTNRK